MKAYLKNSCYFYSVGSFDNMTFSGLGRRREQLPTDYTEVHGNV